MLNVAVIMGRLVADPELRHTPQDIAVTTFTIACDRSYVKSGTERQVDFIDIVAWRSNAEFICKYFRKGSMIAVQGSIQTRSYTDNQGIKRKAFEIVADSVNFADSKRDNSGSSAAYGNSPYGNPPAGNTGDYQSYQRPAVYNDPAPAYQNGSDADFTEIESDDDLPF